LRMADVGTDAILMSDRGGVRDRNDCRGNDGSWSDPGGCVGARSDRGGSVRSRRDDGRRGLGNLSSRNMVVGTQRERNDADAEDRGHTTGDDDLARRLGFHVGILG
jgi:hypothetical protein